ncbi:MULTISPECIES: lipid A deacylase LpxR family protein [unclassified Arcicella]|uniref:lipid A deacylase LpxR family protein n=1 Tax=unclassified Arcicella TaxID=2644986 RepID=UPI00285CC252|nr:MULTISPECIES: lipid A deacylase LpxR family protein [unclassified Arcicella]MDR6562110.1 hypothetical protein [Arcicella sp. BE51]MDR6811982.1 hypothetical protein [Arcicella sp. BE140]MDR6823012.1 hypothetical protein [Arcicella sp. BE139]
MKNAFQILTTIIALIFTNSIFAQKSSPRFMFRLYEDNDFFNVRGIGTDEAYSNGTRFDLFYTKKHDSHFFVDRLLPKAGDSTINVFGWGFAQLMVTPRDITKTEFQPDDYPFAGSLYITHTLYSYNPVKKYDFQTEIIAGVRGPAALAKQTQTLMHRIINDKIPRGWDNQLDNTAIFNINFTAEKEVFHFQKFIEVMAGGRATLGNMLNSVTVYPMVRIGKFSPYFQGFLNQYGSKSSSFKKFQAYFIFKPEASYILTNKLMNGEVNNSKTDVYQNSIRNWFAEISYGAVITKGNFGISYNQKVASAYKKGLYRHSVGNLSLYYNW